MPSWKKKISFGLGALLLAGSMAAQAATVDLSLTQCLVDPNPAPRGGEITVKLNYENGSGSVATGPSISFPLPATTSYVDGSAPTNCSLQADTLVCDFASLPGQTSGTLEFKLKTSGTTGNSIAGTATFNVGSGDSDSLPGNNTQLCSATIDNGADLSAVLSGPTEVPGGSTISWTVNGGNLGPNSATNQIFSTTLPNTLTYESASGTGWSCVASGQDVTCTRTNALNSGANYPQLTLVTELAAGVDSGQVTLSGSISSAVLDPYAPNNTSTHTVNVLAGADLQVSVTAPAIVSPSEQLTYTLTAKNNGPSDASDGLGVTFELPAGFSPVGVPVPTGSDWGVCSWSGQVLSCPFAGNYASGREETISVTATAPNVTEPTLFDSASDSRAQVAGGTNGPVDPQPGNNSNRKDVMVANANAVDLAFTKTKSPSPVAVGDTISSVFRVTNATGPNEAAAGSITLNDVLDDALEEYVGHTGSWTCTANANTPAAGKTTVRCTNNVALAVGGNSSFTIQTKAKIQGTVQNNATIHHEGNLNPNRNTVISASVTATATTDSPDLEIVKTVDSANMTNTESARTYTLTVKNLSNIDAVSLRITDQLPNFLVTGSGVTLGTPVVSTGSSATFADCTRAGRDITCLQTGGVLKQNETVTVTIDIARPLKAGTWTNTASVFSTTQGDPVRGNNTSTADLTITPIADLEMVSKTVTPTSVQAGVNATYVLTAKNNGPDASQNVVVKDDFVLAADAPGFTFISHDGGAACTGLTPGQSYNTEGRHTLTCTIANLPANEQRTVTIVVRPNWVAGTEGAATLKNEARIYSTTTPEEVDGAVNDIGETINTGRGDNNYKTAELAVTNAGLDVLVITNDAPANGAGPDPLGFDPANGGDNENNNIGYFVSIRNGGPSLATGLQFTYEMTPADGKTVRFIGPQGANLSCTGEGTQVTGPNTFITTCTFSGVDSELPSGSTIDRHLVYRALTIPGDSGYSVDTRVEVKVNENDTNADNDWDTENTTVRVRSDISVDVPDRDPVEVHQPFNWIFNVKNNGPGDSGQTDLTSSLPADMEFTGDPITWKNTDTGAEGTCNNVIECAFGQVKDQHNVEVTVPVRFTRYPDGGSAQICASATTNQVDLDTANNTDCGTVTVIRSSIAGVVYEDLNNNGVQDAGENGIANAEVKLTGVDAYGNDVEITVTTNANGEYLFDRQNPAGSDHSYLNSANADGYTITQVLPTGYFDGKDQVGNAALGGGSHTQDTTELTTDLISGIKLGRDEDATGYLFGEVQGATLSGHVCVDSNGNGICEAGEPGIAGVEITLSGTTSEGQNVCDVLPSCTVITDANGEYSLTVPPSNDDGYTLTQQDNNSSPLNAFKDGNEAAGTLGGTPNNNPAGSDSISGVIVAPGDDGTGYDFGETGSKLSGLVYVDSNDNGERDPDETGIEGVVITLTGKTPDGVDICGNLLPMSACTTTTGPDGRYEFSGLPNGTYEVTETQPAGFVDGKDTAGTGGGVPGGPGTDTISGVVIDGADIDGYLFGERDEPFAGSGSVAGKVWFESQSKDQQQNANEKGLEGWRVEISNGAQTLTTETGPDGSYSFPNLVPGNWEIKFFHPVSGAQYGTPIAQDPNTGINGTVDADNRAIKVTVAPGNNIVEQNLPVDPSGVVYDSVTRQPVSGATVKIVRADGSDASSDLVGTDEQVTGSDGFYQFLLKPGVTGKYQLIVTSPPGYTPGVSAILPACETELTVGNTGAPAYVQNSPVQPAGGVPEHDPKTCPATSAALGGGAGTTQYYLDFNLGGDDVLNNHIPLDPILGGAIIMTKTTPKVNVVRGEMVPYVLTATNTLTSTLVNVAVEDQIPAGFKYVKGSSQIDSLPNEPVVNGRHLKWSNLTLNPGQKLTFKMLLVVGTGVGYNEYVNQTWAMNEVANSRISNVATATVRVVADPTFECSDLIGTVYDDKNRNGYQDKGEPGLPGVRVATPKGWLVTTDNHGRYHIACADVPNEMRGGNFIVKVDERTLPSGYRVVTENPRVVRLSQGRLVKANFGASIHRVVRLDLTPDAFDGKELKPGYQEQMGTVMQALHAEPSILRIAYRLPVGEKPKEARERIKSVTKWVKKNWEPQECCYDLQLEEEIVPAIDSVEVVR